MASWLKNLFAKKEPAGASSAPTYQQLVAQVAELENMLASQGKAFARTRYLYSTRARDNESMLERFRAALEWYAKLENWRPYSVRPDGGPGAIRAHDDRGHQARKALGRL